MPSLLVCDACAVGVVLRPRRKSTHAQLGVPLGKQLSLDEIILLIARKVSTFRVPLVAYAEARGCGSVSKNFGVVSQRNAGVITGCDPIPQLKNYSIKDSLYICIVTLRLLLI